MDKLFRFSDYDIFGYLAPGFIVLFVWDLIFGTHVVIDANWSVSHAAFVVISAYILGHGVAGLAALAVDRPIRLWLGTPANILMTRRAEGPPRPWWHQLVIGDFLVPLSNEVQDRAVRKAGLDPSSAFKNELLGEMLYPRAWSVTKRDPISHARTDAFLRLYGFCRNLTFVTLLAAVALGFEAWAWPSSPETSTEPWYMRREAWAGFALVAAVAMLNRYLKFFRLYSHEVLSTYADEETMPNPSRRGQKRSGRQTKKSSTSL